MKKVFIVMIFAVMTLVAAQISAQPKGDKVKERVERLTKALQLTADQASEIENIYKVQAENRKAQFEQMRKSGQRPDMQAMHAQMAKERADVNAKITKVLTPEQNEKYKQMHAERRGDRLGKGREKQGPAYCANGGFAKMKKELQLTDEQVEQFKQLKHDQQVQRQEAVKKILTPEQYKKMQQMKKPVRK